MTASSSSSWRQVQFASLHISDVPDGKDMSCGRYESMVDCSCNWCIVSH